VDVELPVARQLPLEQARQLVDATDGVPPAEYVPTEQGVAAKEPAGQ
jgi:hypothetical protein